MKHTDNTSLVGMHKFEASGLGKAPFKFVGSFEKVYQASPDSPRQPGATCDYCGTGIMTVCQVRSSDGKLFGVGVNCVEKVGDAGILKAYKNSPEVRARNRAKAQAKDDAIRAEWNILINQPAVIEKLKSSFVQKWNKTMQSQYESLTWIWDHCGASGRNRYLKHLKSLITIGNK